MDLEEKDRPAVNLKEKDCEKAFGCQLGLIVSWLRHLAPSYYIYYS